ncbi:phosphate transport system permease protein PstA [Litchfieldella qijiaojingensis]|uniref:Phosphate transport system permease protein PstA n=1 Tax=Litchfieldella qijiaojingensis TaxID=980347 RepID=A0ABQ2Z7D2_9GAMM|nr:phosphate ABC transporter permease PstA [Halomonas qijiaojingensis]GGY04400.1 phosphate transport system permease protein PstA [Halomonas qijiaojingensis]
MIARWGRRLRIPRGEGAGPWLAAGCVSLSLLMVVALLVLLAGRGLVYFWPTEIELVTLDDGQHFAGHAIRDEPPPRGQLGVSQRLYHTGNRDLHGEVWRWVDIERIASQARPADLVVVERNRWGDFIGRVAGLQEQGRDLALSEAERWPTVRQRLERVVRLREESDALREQVVEPLAKRLAEGRWRDSNDRESLAAELEAANARVLAVQDAMSRDALVLESVNGRRVVQPLQGVYRILRPNAMSGFDKFMAWGRDVWRFLSEGPRAANAAGGVWPAIFGTMLMVMLMSVAVTPFGVLAAVYLNEIAPQGRLTRLVRIGVRNLAGVPSIVYGVFGLGVFVYGIGGTLDEWFFHDRLPSPTFGTGGLLWASLTLALLTLPVVIVATEEGLARIPDAQREGALALGATRAETLRRVVLPMAVPAMLTGVILAIARAAGEVAPLMLVGVAKLAPQVPVDGEFPFLHLERKFMHLGYHILDVGFYSGDIEAAMPLVYATALLLVLVILVLNLTAIFLRHHVKARHGALQR